VAQTSGTKKNDKDKRPPGGQDVGGPQSKTTRAQEENIAGEEGLLESKEEKERKTLGIGGPGGWNNGTARRCVAGRIGRTRGERRGFPLVFYLFTT
jgi:hypothetical protein